MNIRIHLITFFTFLLALGLLKLVWDNPKIILYLILCVVSLLAYGALYLVVKTKMENNKKLGTHPHIKPFTDQDHLSSHDEE